jgi:hypothetical protein
VHSLLEQTAREIFLPLASIAMGKSATDAPQPTIQRQLPNKETVRYFSFVQPPNAPRMPSAMGKSNPDHSLRMSAGAKLMVMWVQAMSYPQFLIAALTRPGSLSLQHQAVPQDESGPPVV